MGLRFFTRPERPPIEVPGRTKLFGGGGDFGEPPPTERPVGAVTGELPTADGSEYGLHHVTNIWRGTELGFNTDETYLASIIGKTVTQITYYTADGVYVLPVSVAL